MKESKSSPRLICAIFGAAVLSNPSAAAAQGPDAWTAKWMMLAGVVVIAYAIWKVFRMLDK